jgi:hypothetical protein
MVSMYRRSRVTGRRLLVFGQHRAEALRITLGLRHDAGGSLGLFAQARGVPRALGTTSLA